jgi:hypothetical protein
MNLKKIIKEEIDDLEWMRGPSDIGHYFVVGKKYILDDEELEFVEYRPEQKTPMDVFKDIDRKGVLWFKKLHVPLTDITGEPRYQTVGWRKGEVEKLFKDGKINIVESEDDFTVIEKRSL